MKLNPNYIQGHTHSVFSLRDGIMSVKDHVDFALKNEKKFVAITDHGSIGGWIDQYTQCKKVGITPIFGIEGYIHLDRDVYLEEKDKSKINHIILLAQNEIGFKNIIKIHNDAWQHFYKKPIMSYDYLFEHSEGVIVSTACMSGTLPRLLEQNDFGAADSFVKNMKSHFSSRFFIELMLIDMDEQTDLNRKLIKIAKKHNVPLLIGNDPHYATIDDNKAHQISLLLQRGQTVKDLESGKGWSFSAQDLYMKTEKDLYEDWEAKYKNDKIFTEEVFVEAIQNSDKITDTIEEMYLEHPARLPKYPNGKEILERMVINGFAEKIEVGIIPEEKADEYIKQIKHELKVIEDMELVDYFLLINDIYDFCADNDIGVGPGRGSVSSSLVTFLMGVTKLDPLKYNFIFERFLNPARKTRLKIFD